MRPAGGGVRPNSLRGGFRRGVEIDDGPSAPRQRAPFVAVDEPELHGHAGIADAAREQVMAQSVLAQQIEARAPHAHEIELRRGDAARELEAARARARSVYVDSIVC